MTQARRFVVGARVDNKGASWPFCYLRIDTDGLSIRGWPIPWFSWRRIPKDEIGKITGTTVLGSPVLRIYDKNHHETGDGIAPTANYSRVVEALRENGYEVNW